MIDQVASDREFVKEVAPSALVEVGHVIRLFSETVCPVSKNRTRLTEAVSPISTLSATSYHCVTR